MHKTSIKPIPRKNDIVIQKIDDEVLIYDLISNKALCLNHSAAAIWEGCDGATSIADLTDNVGKKLNTKLTTEFVSFALRQLIENGLIEEYQSDSKSFSGVSRREIIRKIGLTSAVGLPMVASVVAPNSLNAQSNVCVIVIDGCQCNPGFMSGDNCTGSTQAGMACSDASCRCIASPGFDDCVP